MRIIAQIKNVEHGKRFVNFLKEQGIKSECDIVKETDWGSPDYGSLVCRIWVYDEDQVEDAQHYLSQFLEEPHHPDFSKSLSPIEERAEQNSLHHTFEDASEKIFKEEPVRKVKRAKSLGTLTFYILLICVWLFIWSKISSPRIEEVPSYLPPMAVVSSPVYKELLFDYPEKYVLADQLIKLYGLEALENPRDLPKEGQHLTAKFLNTLYWEGYYDKFVEKIRNPEISITIKAPMFEKIQQGQIWRLFSPCFLHSDIFHLFFNMAWLFILGQQMESRLRIPRLLLFMLITGIISNTMQYLMSGPNFIGFSGILCGMILFTWMRQVRAPWEGYNLNRSTMGLITLFILMMVGIQLISFFTEIYFDGAFSPGIANTAHLVGAFIGFLLSYIPLFHWKPR